MQHSFEECIAESVVHGSKHLTNGNTVTIREPGGYCCNSLTQDMKYPGYVIV